MRNYGGNQALVDSFRGLKTCATMASWLRRLPAAALRRQGCSTMMHLRNYGGKQAFVIISCV